jgi:hypothetical protein
MRDFFANTNPGLSRRFQLSDAFKFVDFNNSELEEILRFKIKDQNLEVTPPAITAAIGVLSRARNKLNFGNSGDVENLIAKAKIYNMGRNEMADGEGPFPHIMTLEPQDFDIDHDRATRAETNLQVLFRDVVGCENIIKT